MSATFVAVYRGPSIAEAQLIAVSADPTLVADVSARLLDRPRRHVPDPAMAEIERGRRSALRMIRREAQHHAGG